MKLGLRPFFGPIMHLTSYICLSNWATLLLFTTSVGTIEAVMEIIQEQQTRHVLPLSATRQHDSSHCLMATVCDRSSAPTGWRGQIWRTHRLAHIPNRSAEAGLPDAE